MNTNLNPPKLGQTQPVYPPLTQLIRVTATVVSGPTGFTQVAGSSMLGPRLYVSFVQQLRDDGSLLPRDREPCLASDVVGLGVSPGFYIGRLAGTWTSLPIYEIVGVSQASGGGPGSVTVSNITINNGSITIPASNGVPPNPPAGSITLYEIGGSLYYKDSDGTIFPITIGGSSGGLHPWDALQATDLWTVRWHVAGAINPGLLGSGGTFSPDVLYTLPILALRGCTIDGVGIRVEGAAVAVKFRLGLYKSTSTPGNLYPSSLIRDYGEITTDTTGFAGEYTLTGTNTLQAGKLYWLAVNMNTLNSLIDCVNNSNCVAVLGFALGSLLGPPGVGFNGASVYGAMPSVYPAGASLIVQEGTLSPALFFHASA